MNNAKLTPWLIVMTIVVVTLVGPMTVLKDVTSDNLTSQSYWLDLLAATIRAFAAAILSAIALVAGVLGIPAIRGANAASATVIPVTPTTFTGGSSITVTTGPQPPPPPPSPAPVAPHPN